MLLYIGSEFSRAIRSKEFRKYTLVILIVSILANLSIIAFRDYVYGTNDGTYGYNIIMFAGGFSGFPTMPPFLWQICSSAGPIPTLISKTE